MKKFLLVALTIFAILGCSSDDNMPLLSSINSKSYCHYNINGIMRCKSISTIECEQYGGDNYGNNSTCTHYCGYYIGSNYKCTPMSDEDCKRNNGDDYRNDNTCSLLRQQELQYVYCLYYNDSKVCNIMSSKNCNNYGGEEFSSQEECNEARQEQQNSYSYCLYLVGGNYRCSYLNVIDCRNLGGDKDYYDNTCGGNLRSSSSSFIPTPPQRSSSSSEYTGGSCYGEDYNPDYIGYGYQRWMRKNLSCYVPGSKCYKDDPDNCNKYGRLYNWAAAMQACPEGWRLPSRDEWENLFEIVLEENEDDDDAKFTSKEKYLKIEKYLKATKGWGSAGNGQDTYGFAAMPGGYGAYDIDGNLFFYSVGSHGYWWSSNTYNNSKAYNLHMSDGEGFSDNDKKYLFSVRCIENY